jgi:hypothetical protein
MFLNDSLVADNSLQDVIPSLFDAKIKPLMEKT